MKTAGIMFESPSRETLRLCAYAALKVYPPRCREGVDSFTAMLKNNPHDFEAVSNSSFL
jgi:hypothetical protein